MGGFIPFRHCPSEAILISGENYPLQSS
jgi:hypothetical protein